MPSYFNRIGVGFEVRGATQYERQLNRNAQANLAYGRSLPIREMGTYRQELRNVNRDLATSGTNFGNFGTILIRTEQQSKRARLGFTQFRKLLNAREIRQYGVEVGRLDHLLGSTNRTLRVTNQRLADKGFSRLGLENLTNVTQRHLRELQRVRGGLENAFDAKRANDYIRSLEEVEQNLRRITLSSRQLQRYNIPTLRRGGRVDTRRISREFGFPQRAPPRARDIPRDALRGLNNRLLGGIDRQLLNPARDAQARIARNSRELDSINRQIRPLERAAAQARTNLSVIRQGTSSALNDLEQQIEIYGQLARQGDGEAQRRLAAVREQHSFIQRNVQAREQELIVAERSLSVARARTEQARSRLSLENQSLKQNGIQRSIAQDIFNLVKQTVSAIARNPLRTLGAAGALATGTPSVLAAGAVAQRGLRTGLQSASEINNSLDRARRVRESQERNAQSSIARLATLRRAGGIDPFTPGLGGSGTPFRQPTRIEDIFGRDATSFGASLVQTISNVGAALGQIQNPGLRVRDAFNQAREAVDRANTSLRNFGRGVRGGAGRFFSGIAGIPGRVRGIPANVSRRANAIRRQRFGVEFGGITRSVSDEPRIGGLGGSIARQALLRRLANINFTGRGGVVSDRVLSGTQQFLSRRLTESRAARTERGRSNIAGLLSAPQIAGLLPAIAGEQRAIRLPGAIRSQGTAIPIGALQGRTSDFARNLAALVSNAQRQTSITQGIVPGRRRQATFAGFRAGRAPTSDDLQRASELRGQIAGIQGRIRITEDDPSLRGLIGNREVADRSIAQARRELAEVAEARRDAINQSRLQQQLRTQFNEQVRQREIRVAGLSRTHQRAARQLQELRDAGVTGRPLREAERRANLLRRVVNRRGPRDPESNRRFQEQRDRFLGDTRAPLSISPLLERLTVQGTSQREVSRRFVQAQKAFESRRRSIERIGSNFAEERKQIQNLQQEARRLETGTRGFSPNVLGRQFDAVQQARSGLFGRPLPRGRDAGTTRIGSRRLSPQALQRLLTPITDPRIGAFAFGQARNAPAAARLGLAAEALRARQRGPFATREVSARGFLGQRGQFGGTSPILSAITNAVNPLRQAFEQRFSLQQAVESAASPEIRQAFDQRFNLQRAFENAASPQIRRSLERNVRNQQFLRDVRAEQRFGDSLPDLRGVGLSNQLRDLIEALRGGLRRGIGQPERAAGRFSAVRDDITSGVSLTREDLVGRFRAASEVLNNIFTHSSNVRDTLVSGASTFADGLRMSARPLTRLLRDVGLITKESARSRIEYIRSGAAIRDISTRLSAIRLPTLTLERPRRAAELLGRAFTRINLSARNFRDTIERTRLVFGNIRISTDSIASSLARTVFTGGRDIARRLQAAGQALRTPGGILDSFRSADAQIEKIDNRLRRLGRDLGAPQDRLRIAQAEFNLIEAKVQESLRRTNQRIEELNIEASIITDREEQIKAIREERIDPLQLEIQVIRNQADIAVSQLQDEFLESLSPEQQRAGFDAFATEYRELSKEIENTGKRLERAQTNVEKADVAIASRKARANSDGVSLQATAAQVTRLATAEIELTRAREQNNEAIEKRNELLGRASFDDVEERIKAITDAVAEQTRLRTEEINIAQREILQNKVGIQVAKERERANTRLQRFIDTREQLERRLESERERFQITKNTVRLKELEAARERTILEIRRRQAAERQQTGAGAPGIGGAAGDLARNVQENIQARQIASVGDNLQRISDITAASASQLSGFTSELAQANNVAGQFNDTVELSGDVLEEAEARQIGLARELRNTVAEIIRNPVESIFSVGRAAARQVTNLAETVVSRVVNLTTTAGGLLGRLTLRTVDSIAQIPIRILGIIPVVGEGIRGVVQSIYDLFRGLVSGIGNFGIRIASGVAGIARNILVGVYDIGKGIVEGLGNIAENALRTTIERGSQILQTVFGAVIDLGQRAGQAYLNALSGVRDAVASVFRGVADRVVDNFRAAFEAVRGLATDSAQFMVRIFAESFKFVRRLILNPFGTLFDVIKSIGAAIKNLILLPLRPIGLVLSAPIRALGFVLNAFNFNQVPQTTQGLRQIQKEGSRTTSVFDQASKALQKNLRDSANTSAQTLKAYRGVRRESEDFTGGLVKNIRGIDDIFRILSQGADSLTTSVSSLRTSFSNLALGATGALAILGGVLAVGKRADSFKGIILAFRRTGIALQELRDASGGTLRDIDAMRAANVALSNTPEIVRQAFATSFKGIRESSNETLKAFTQQIGNPRASSGIAAVMDIARTQAIRTGESTKFLFESLTSGIKRSSPKLIDNTGLVIRIGRANERFAEAMGKTVKELTAEETQLALLAETIRAGSLALDEIGDDTEGARQKFERFTASLGNIADRITFGLQPALEGFLNFFNREILARLDDAAVNIASGLFVVLDNFRHGINTLFTALGETTRTFVGNIFRTLGVDIVRTQDQALGALENIFFGAVKVFASLAGAIAGLWDIITGTIHSALETLASWLIGESPPPAGPLRNIDKGARAIALAWQEGFIGIDLRGFERFARSIEDVINNAFSLTGIPRPDQFLDNIVEEAERRFGHLDLDGVTARLAELDAAIQPFETRLGIVREHFDAIQAAAQHSLDAINRQINSQLQAVIDGSEEAAAQVRSLDQLHSRIQRGLALDRRPLDQADISIGFLRAQQAEERALLGIVQQRLQAEAKSRTDAEEETREPGAFDFPEPSGDPFADFLLPGTQEFADRARAAFDAAFEQARSFITGVDTTDQATFFDDLLGSGAAGTFRQPNIFERFFASIPSTLDSLPENVKGFLTSVDTRITEFLNSQAVTNAERNIERLLGLQTGSIDFSSGYENLKNFFGTELPKTIITTIGGTSERLGVNEFIRTIFGLEDFNLGEFLVNLPQTIIQLPANIQARWLKFVRDSETAVTEGGRASFIQRLVEATFNEDFTLDIPAAAKVTWEYLTSVSAVPGESLRADVTKLWNEGIPNLFAGVGEFAGSVLTLGLNIASTILNLTFGTVELFTDSGGEGGQNPFEGLLLGTIINSLFGIGLAPLKAIEYVAGTPAQDITFGGLVLHILGLTAENVTALFGAGNDFLNTTLPNAIRAALGDNNLILQIYEIGNEFRQNVHRALFGGDISFPTSPVDVSGIIPNIESLESRQRSSRARLIKRANELNLPYRQTLELVARGEEQAREEYLRDRVAQDDASLLLFGSGTPSPNLNPNIQLPIVQQIINTVASIPQAVTDFFIARPNFLNLHSILVAAGIIDENTTLASLWESAIDELALFAGDPVGYFTTKLTEAWENSSTSIEAWANSPDNPIVQTINSLGTALTGNEDFNIGQIISDALGTVDDIARSIRFAFGQATIQDFAAEGFSPSGAFQAFSEQESRSLGQVLLSALEVLWNDAVAFITAPENANNFSLVDSFLQLLTGNTGLTVPGIVAEIDRVLQQVISGESTLSNAELPQQTIRFLDSLAIGIFGVPFDKVTTTVSNIFNNLFDNLAAFFDPEQTPVEKRNLDTFVQAVFDNPDLMAADIVPGIIEAIVNIPGALLNAFAELDLFGEFVSATQTVTPIFTVGDLVVEGENELQNALAQQSLTGDLPDFRQSGARVTRNVTRRFSLRPFFESLFGTIQTEAIRFFDENPLGNAITGAFRWFSGDTDFTAQGFVDGLAAFFEADEDERNAQILSYLQDHPNLFGLDSIVQFFTGDNEFTLAGLFESAINQGGGVLGGLGRALQRVGDSITGAVRLSDVLPGFSSEGGDPVIAHRENIFQRVGNSIATAARSFLTEAEMFFREHGNVLGLNNFIKALTGGKANGGYDTVDAWLADWNNTLAGGGAEGGGGGEALTLPDHINNLLTAINRLTTGEGLVTSGDSPFDALFNAKESGTFAWHIASYAPGSISYAFDTTKPDSFAAQIANFFDADSATGLNQSISNIGSTINSVYQSALALHRILFGLGLAEEPEVDRQAKEAEKARREAVTAARQSEIDARIGDELYERLYLELLVIFTDPNVASQEQRDTLIQNVLNSLGLTINSPHYQEAITEFALRGRGFGSEAGVAIRQAVLDGIFSQTSATALLNSTATTFADEFSIAADSSNYLDFIPNNTPNKSRPSKPGRSILASVPARHLLTNVTGISPETAREDGYSLGALWRDGVDLGINSPLVDPKVQDFLLTIKASSPPKSGPLSEIDEWGKSIGQSWVDAFASVFSTFFGGGTNEEGEAIGWAGILNSAYDSTVAFSERLPSAFDTLPLKIYQSFAEPIVGVFNYVIERYNEMVGNINATNFQSALQLGIPFIALGQVPTLSTAVPDFIGAASGGVFGAGGLIVGEKGPELIVPAERIAVFPNQATRGLESLTNFVQGAVHQTPIYNNTTNNYNNTTNTTNDDHSMAVTIEGGERGDRVLSSLMAFKMRRP